VTYHTTVHTVQVGARASVSAYVLPTGKRKLVLAITSDNGKQALVQVDKHDLVDLLQRLVNDCVDEESPSNPPPPQQRVKRNKP
jgi:hypothetical protein